MIDRLSTTATARLRGLDGREAIATALVVALGATTVAGLLFPGSPAGTAVAVVFARSTLSATLRLSVPIALAALGGILSERSGVINIGLEGLLIVSAFGAVYATDVTGSLVVGTLAGVLASTLLAALFAVVCIAFRADQIIAGLAVWLIALGLAPFASQVVYGAPNTDSVATPPTLPELVAGLPVLAGVVRWLAAVPVVGVLFDAGAFVYLTLAAVAATWYLLTLTQFGRWIRASGENPKALDTAGVSVSRVRYAAVLLSGVLSGLGGAALSLGLGQFTGNGPTMVNGKGFVAIVAYLLGNYSPVGTYLSTLLFAGLEGVQIALQLRDLGLPAPLVRTVPFVTVVVVLALVGRTRLPAAAGEHYESGED